MNILLSMAMFSAFSMSMSFTTALAQSTMFPGVLIAYGFVGTIVRLRRFMKAHEGGLIPVQEQKRNQNHYRIALTGFLFGLGKQKTLLVLLTHLTFCAAATSSRHFLPGYPFRMVKVLQAWPMIPKTGMPTTSPGKFQSNLSHFS